MSMTLRSIIVVLFAALSFAHWDSTWAKDPVPILELDVQEGDWAGAPRENVHAVCFSAGSELIKYFPGRKIAPIMVGNKEKVGPITLFAKGPKGETQILLSSRGLHWSQYAYQFSHELCHVLCNYRKANNPQLWFEESLCETASLFTLQQMAKTWKTQPPYANWSTFASSLETYAADHFKKTTKVKEKTFAEWYRANEAELNKSAVNRELNQVVAAHALLPLLQKNPEHWVAVSYLNQWDGSKPLTFSEYLTDWHKRVPDKHKSFIKEVAKEFEITVE